MLSIFLALSFAQEPAAITLEQAVGLGMPRLHEPFSDCGCVAMTWQVNGEPVVVEVPREEIALVRHRVIDGPHELSIHTKGGIDVLLEQAPCPFVYQGIAKYAYVLEVPSETVDALGAAVEPSCGEMFQEVKDWEDMRARARAAEAAAAAAAAQPVKTAALELISAKGDDAAVLGVRTSLSAARVTAGECWNRADVAADARVVVTVATKSGSPARVKTGRVGDAVVDSCFEELARNVRLPQGNAKVRVAYSPPR